MSTGRCQSYTTTRHGTGTLARETPGVKGGDSLLSRKYRGGTVHSGTGTTPSTGPFHITYLPTRVVGLWGGHGKRSTLGLSRDVKRHSHRRLKRKILLPTETRPINRGSRGGLFGQSVPTEPDVREPHRLELTTPPGRPDRTSAKDVDILPMYGLFRKHSHFTLVHTGMEQ